MLASVLNMSNIAKKATKYIHHQAMIPPRPKIYQFGPIWSQPSWQHTALLRGPGVTVASPGPDPIPASLFLFWAGPDTATPWKSDPTPIWPAHGIGHCKFHPRGLDDNLPCLESKRLREWLDKPGKDSKQESWGNQKMQQNSTWGLMGGNQPVLQVHVIPNTTKT